MASAAIISAVKLSLRLTTNKYDSEISDLIDAALLDLGIAGVTEDDTTDPLVKRAVTTYVRTNFGQPDDYDRLQASYDLQKAQMSMSTGYTDWGDIDGSE